MPINSKRHPSPRMWLAEALALAVVMVTVLALSPVRASTLDQAMGAVFSVHSADDADRFLGSAFVWGQSAEVAVTNAHVVGDAAEVRLVDARGNEEIATVIARDPLRDVAVISVQVGRGGLVPVGDAPGLGAEVWALGAPLGVEFTVTEGMISALARQVDAEAPIRMVQHDAAVNPGSSGGPLVDATGALVGMNSQIADGSRMFVGIAYAISADDLSRIVTGLIEETLLPLPKLGLTARPVDRKLATVLGTAPEGLLIDEVTPGSLAAEAGVQAGDILLALGGRVLDETGALAFALEAAQAKGDSASLSVLRAGKATELTLALLAEEGDSTLALRDIAGAKPKKVAEYTLAELGVTLDDQGRVTAVTENSPALYAGLAVGDRIAMVNGQPIDSVALTALQITAATLLLLEQNGGTRHILLDPFADMAGFRPVGGANVLDPAVVVF